MPTVYKRPKRYTEHHELRAAVARMLRAYGARVADGDMPDFVELVGLRQNLEAAIAEAVPGLRAHGYSWADIGEAVGISKQAAQQRWGDKS